MRIGIVASACEFPDAHTPQELWSTVLHGRRNFRQIPSERLNTTAYIKGNLDPDGIYPIEAALLEGYKFDRERFRIAKSTFERTDIAHWLALDVASRALSDLGINGIAAECDSTGVIVANSLTGEVSRSYLMRYRWPYVERLVCDLKNSNGSRVVSESDLRALELAFKAPFPSPDEDSLAGALANTIAGRIANYHSLRGGAYTVDGACASSLVAVVNAIERIELGKISCAVVGAVDVSLDPFELVGFARNGALAKKLMRIFDQESEGFWPGEGCGFVVLANEEVIARQGWPVLAWVHGTGMSADGEGGLTRPTVEGQALAASRAWENAALNPAEADYFEAHGTGTITGDPIELAGLATLLGAVAPPRPIPVGSVKSIIGHTKAAAGIAGLLNAVAICRERIIPATTGCHNPHKILNDEIGRRVNVKTQAEHVTHSAPILVGINSFGFGGINCHVVVKGAEGENSHKSTQSILPLHRGSILTTELFQIAAFDENSLLSLLEKVCTRARSLSRAQLGDLASALGPVSDFASWRVCLIATTPQDLETVAHASIESIRHRANKSRYIGNQFCWSAPSADKPRIALMFPGQGISLQMSPLIWASRYPGVTGAADRAAKLLTMDLSDTAVIQPLLGEVALAGVQLLKQFDVMPSMVFGHSFGELAALSAAGILDANSFRQLAIDRGRLMSDNAPQGAMLAIRASRAKTSQLSKMHGVEIACENGNDRYVLSGAKKRIEEVKGACANARIAAEILPTNRAFHSSLMNSARDALTILLAQVTWSQQHTRMVSTITGGLLDGTEDLAQLLTDQVSGPVKFSTALDAVGDVDLIIEVGASSSLTGLIEEREGRHALSLELFSPSDVPALLALGAIWTFGGNFSHSSLYHGRLIRPCSIEDKPFFLVNPCEQHSTQRMASIKDSSVFKGLSTPDPKNKMEQCSASSIAELYRVVADVTGLPLSSLSPDLRLLADLHLNSIRARHVIALTARHLKLAQLPFDLSKLSQASLADIALYLDRLKNLTLDENESAPPSIAAWLRLFNYAWTDVTDPPTASTHFPGRVILNDSLAPLDNDCLSLLSLENPDVGELSILVLPSDPTPMIFAALLDSIRQLEVLPRYSGLLVLQGAQLANGFMQSVAAEMPDYRFCCVEYEYLNSKALMAGINECVSLIRGYGELRIRGASSQRRQTVFADLGSTLLSWEPEQGEVIVVTGGGRGIGAASALALAEQVKCQLALIGRSAEDDPEIAYTLQSLRQRGNKARYFCCDLSNNADCRSVVDVIQTEMGKVSILIHSAGVNQPTQISKLGIDEFNFTVASKVTSLANLLENLSTQYLRLVIGYSSIIAEFGLSGEAHYALANEWLNNFLADFAKTTPTCRVIPICWSAWGEIGMATRLEGVLESLHRYDTRTINTSEGIDVLMRLLKHKSQGPVIVSGRYGRVINQEYDIQHFQSHRYLERPRVYYPCVELVAEAQLCSDGDRYLRDHAPFDVPVFPLVCALEAMVSAAQCLCQQDQLPLINDLYVGEALSTLLGQRFVLRTAAIVEKSKDVRIEIRSSTTNFDVIHFSAYLTWSSPDLTGIQEEISSVRNFPAKELLYQGLCFHGPRFHRVATVEAVSSTFCRFSTGTTAVNDWYGPLLPKCFCAGHPSVRDAVIHAIQMCMPNQIVLPTSVTSIYLGKLESDRQYFVTAKQTSCDTERYYFDIQVCDSDGRLVEKWTKLELIAVQATLDSAAPSWPVPIELLQPLIARLATDEVGAKDATAGVVSNVGRSNASHAALSHALGKQVKLKRRMDGAIFMDDFYVSTSHAEELTIAVTRASGPIAVDMQFLPSYEDDDWRLMLGDARSYFAEQLSQNSLYGPINLSIARLITWTISECLIKLGCTNWQPNFACCRNFRKTHTGLLWSFEFESRRITITSVLVGSSALLRPAVIAVAIDDISSLEHSPISSNVNTSAPHLQNTFGAII